MWDAANSQVRFDEREMESEDGVRDRGTELNNVAIVLEEETCQVMSARNRDAPQIERGSREQD